MDINRVVPDDNQIVEMFLARDDGAISAVSEKYGSELRRIAVNILDDLGAAEECENDAYLKAWTSIPPQEPRTYLFAYLARIARAVAIDRYRRQSAEKRSAQYTELTQEIENSIPALQSVEDEIDANLLSEAVNSFLRDLPSEKRFVFVRRYWYLDSVAEIAKRSGLTQGNVKTMLFRLRTQLKEHLEKEGYKI